MNIENYLPHTKNLSKLDLETKKKLKSKVIKQHKEKYKFLVKKYLHKAIEVYDYEIEDYNYYYVVGVKKKFSKLFGFDYNLVGMNYRNKRTLITKGRINILPKHFLKRLIKYYKDKYNNLTFINNLIDN